MQRVTITIDEDLLQAVDSLMEKRGYSSRSEAIRDMVRASATLESLSKPNASCVATLTHVYDHGTRELAQRVTEAYHANHSLTIASTQVYLDHDSCLEVSVLCGEVGEIREFAQSLATQRGVRHSNLHLIPVQVEVTKHVHGAHAKPHEHLHA